MSDNKISHLTTTLASFELAGINPITPLALRSMFWRPNYLEQSAWLEHIPFAFWLAEAHHPRVLVELGAHSGVAYFAFCQGISRLGLNTRCFAVDTWKDNGQIYDKLSAHNDAQYSGFSRLVRSTFDDVLENFSNDSVDLLHIDVLHNFETIKQTFEAWLPKLSNNAVVILHGTNIREKHNGIFKYFEELKEQYPWFEFSHGQGLGILGIGKEQNEILSSLFNMTGNDASTQVVREVFSRLGRACTDSLGAINNQIIVDELTHQVENQRKLCEEFKISFEETKKDLESRKREAIEVKTKLQNQIEQHAAEQGQLNERINLLQETRQELKIEVERLQGRVETAFVRLAEKGQELNRLALESAEFQKQIYIYSEHAKEKEKKLTEMDLALQDARNSNSHLTQIVAAREHALTEYKTHTEQLEQALTEYKTHTEQLEQALTEYKTRTEQLEQALTEYKTRTEQLEQALTEYKTHTEQLEQALQDTRNSNANLTQVVAEKEKLVAKLDAENKRASEEIDSLSNKLNERFVELATLTNLLIARDSAIRTKDQHIENERQRTARLKKSISWKITSPIRAFARTFRLAGKKTSSIGSQIKLVEQSGLFESRWYRDQYPDVADTGMEPIEHYLRYGAAEGRDPGPNFNTKWYLDTYSDIAEAGVNPLVHYIKVGKQEGRQPVQRRAEN